MCMFSGSVNEVNSTNIFVGDVDGGQHACIYSMEVDAREPVAMVLPVPIAREHGGKVAEDAVTFVNLDGYPNLFKDMKRLFPVPRGGLRSRGAMLGGPACAASTLKVHDVGSYVASFVPQPVDFRRLDERFRLSPRILSELIGYRGFSYVVFQLKEGRNKFHPMAYRYTPAKRLELFFPTVHVHDGTLPREADYDHILFAQPESQIRCEGWEPSCNLPKDALEMDQTAGLIHPDRGVMRLKLNGDYPNHDYLVSVVRKAGETRSPVVAA